MAQPLAGKTVLITGATSGIGLEAAVVLAQAGGKVVIVGRDPALGLEPGQRAALRLLVSSVDPPTGSRVPRPAPAARSVDQQRRDGEPEAGADRRWDREHLRDQPPRLFPAHQPAARPGGGQRAGPRLFMISAAEGGATITHLVLSPVLEGKSGLYFEKNQPIAPAPLALDDALAAKLWDESAKLVKLGTWVRGPSSPGHGGWNVDELIGVETSAPVRNCRAARMDE